MLDARQVLETVHDGNAPPDWDVLRARTGDYLSQARFALGAGIAFTLVGLGILILLVVRRPVWSDFAVLGFFGLAMAILYPATLAAGGLRLRRVARESAGAVLVVTPEACVVGNLDTLTVTYAINYAHTAEITLLGKARFTAKHASLQVQSRAGDVWTWQFESRMFPAQALALFVRHGFIRYTVAQSTPAGSED